MSENPSPPPLLPLLERIAHLEQRLARVEQRLELPPLAASVTSPPAPDTAATVASAEPVAPSIEPPAEDLEFVVGQNWFAIVGIMVLTCGVGFALSLPLPSLPAVAPTLMGLALAGGFFLAAHLGRKAFELVAGYCRGAGAVLLFFSVLRLYFFGAVQVLDVTSASGRWLLAAAVALNVALAWRQRSQHLLGLALLTGGVAAVAVGSPLFVFVAIAAIAGLALYAALRWAWPALVLMAIAVSYATHCLWMVNRPWQGRPFQFVDPSRLSLGFLLIYLLILGVGPLWRRNRQVEDPFTILGALFNCGMGYGLMLLHSTAVNPRDPVATHFTASLVLLGLAVAFYERRAGRTSTFFYAMTGYMALSVAIVKAFSPPEVFLWLSLQSLVVVATALWFRSRFIVVANFFIFVAIVLGYMILTDREQGVSFGFGVVALVTARVLNWKKERLELKTGLMRNAYLVSAFFVIPYALYHVLPHAYVGVSWIGVALFYYAMNFIINNPRYRWMGHFTLLGTVLYLLIIGLTQLSPVYRIISFILLGAVLLVVSLLFTQFRRRSRLLPTDARPPATRPPDF